jgi:Uma2 family endonuclease
MTVEQLLEERAELADGGRWTELVAGRTVMFTAPSIEHGTVVLNLSKALAAYSQKEQRGYACFEIGLVLSRAPDTVRFPAVSFFTEGPMFAESDKQTTDARPTLVVEIASTNDRRRDMRQRVAAWLEWGVPQIWVLDPHEKQAHAFERESASRRVSQHETLFGTGAIADFSLKVADLFAEPKWWK